MSRVAPAKLCVSNNTAAAEGNHFGNQQDQSDPQRIGDEQMCDLHPHWGEQKNVYHPRAYLQESEKHHSQGESPCERRALFAKAHYDGKSNQKTSEQSSDDRVPDTQAYKDVD
jgi:hypothetical protein